VANPIPNGAIVVGVDGSETADHAVARATRQASLEDRPLVIAHAFGAIGQAEAAGLHFDGGAFDLSTRSCAPAAKPWSQLQPRRLPSPTRPSAIAAVSRPV
jgi:nucleotide-binding universal stress UspA family protein